MKLQSEHGPTRANSPISQIKASRFRVTLDDYTLDQQLVGWELTQHELKLTFEIGEMVIQDDGLAVGSSMYPQQEDYCYVDTAKVNIGDFDAYRLDLRFRDFSIKSGTSDEPLRVEVIYSSSMSNR